MRNFLRLGKRSWQALLLTLLGVAAGLSARAQTVSSYSFAQTAGTYTALTGGTVVATATASGTGATALDDVNYTVALPFSFTFNGTAYTSITVNTNGSAFFGTAPTTGTYTPISGTGTYAGALAPLGRDLQGRVATPLGEIRTQTLGSGTSQVFVIQYSNFERYLTAADNFNFQIQLAQTTNAISFVYGAFTLTASVNTTQVGLRGASIADYNNRLVTSSTTWATSTAGTASTSPAYLSSTIKPTTGLTYTFTPPAGCTGTPTAGTTVATNTIGCGTVASTLSLSGATTGVAGLTYQWQQSATASGTYTNIAGATAATYAASITSTTYFQAVVRCTNSGLSSTSASVGVTVNNATPPAYATLPVTEGFESWTSRCSNSEIPSTYWKATPVTGDNSWRRNDQGFSTAGWFYINDEPTPYTVTKSQGSYSARFHSFGTDHLTAAQQTGTLDLYVNLSGAGTKTLTFDYFNKSGTDNLQVQLSEDGGVTFPTTLLTLSTAAAFNGQSVVISSTSATAVVRLKANSDGGNDDIGIDNLKLNFTPSCAAVAFAPTTSITKNSATVNFAAAAGGSTYSLTYSPGGTSQTVLPGAVPLTGLQPYTLYNVTVTTNCAGSITNTATTTFRTAIGNDDCSGAVALTPGMPGDACAAQAYTTEGATASTPPVGTTGATGCGGEADDDVWFSFVATKTRHTITVAPSFDFDPVVELRSGGTCPGTYIRCEDTNIGGGTAGTETLVATGLTVGSTYFVRVYNYDTGSGSATFDICVTTPPNVPCAQVTNAAVTNTGYSSTTATSTAQVTFTGVSGAATTGGYYLTLTPTAGGSITTGTFNSSPVSLELDPSTSYTLTISTNCANGGFSDPVTVVFTSQSADLIVDGSNSPYSASGAYNNVTINNGGTANLSANLGVVGTLTINSGGTLNTVSSQVLGGGNFVLNAGGTLGIGGGQGIVAGPATSGVIRNTGATRSFSTDANYVYTGGTQVTGTGLTGARNLSKTAAGTLTVSAPVSVSQVVSATSGPIAANSNLTLLSSASGTALAVNGSTTNVVSGTLTAQRYIGGIGGSGYRMVATPVTTTLTALTSGGSSIDVSGAGMYNSSATPGAVTPYPTLFTYDQTRAGTTSNNLAAFNQGFVAVTALTGAFTRGQGVDFNTTGGQTLKFTGAVNNADYTATLANNGNAAGGWALLGNPFPAPFSWDGVTLGSSVSTTVYVSKATGQYSGTYTSYTRNAPMQVPPRASSLIPLGQAFFVRSAASTNNGITIPGSSRATTFDPTLHPVQRQAADTRTALRLALTGAGQDDDYAVVYFDEQATAALDVQLDAVKFFNTGEALNLYTSIPGQALALNALPLPGTASVSVPVEVRVPQAGTYALALHELANLPAGTTLELRDALTGTRTVLSEGTSYSFSTATTAATGRFMLVLNGTSSPLAVAAGLSAEAVTVYPNPAHHRFTVSVPGVSGATRVQAELVNTLGQVVRRTSVALPATGTSFVLEAPEVATGVYVLRLQTGSTSIAKRVTLE